MRFIGALVLSVVLSVACGAFAFAAEPVANSSLTYTYVEKEGVKAGDRFGLFINDASGKEVAAIPFEDEWGGSVWRVTLSPDGSTLAMLFGVECGTSWHFFDFPSGKARGEYQANISGFAWRDGKTAVFTHARDYGEARPCESQCCLGLSVVSYTVGGDLDFLAEVTPECDFGVQKLEGASVLADKTCMSLDKWRTLEPGTPETIRIGLGKPTSRE